MKNQIPNDLKYIATALDSSITLPNGWKIGWDGILGFIPGLGNIITDSLSFYILFRSAILGCPPSVLLNMGLNIFIDNLVDKVPVLGFIFDFIWKSNTKNVSLLENYLNNPTAVKKQSRWLLAGTFLILILLHVCCITLTVFAVSWAIDFIKWSLN